jgi:hypothetical protein
MNNTQKSNTNTNHISNNNHTNNHKNTNNHTNDDGSKSVVLSLATLSKEYETVLIKYKQAQKDYIDYLKSQSTNMACSKYSSDSTGIDQDCYNEIWKKAGCNTTGKNDANSDYSKSQTLNGLIYDSYLWATMTDSTHRDGCYLSTTDSSDYSTATEPNYNINAEPLTEIKGATFWGSSKLDEGDATSLDQCKAMCSSDALCSGATYNPDKAYCWTRQGEGAIKTGMVNDYAIIPANLKYLKVIQSLSEKLTNINSEILKTINKGKPLYSNQEIEIKQQTINLNRNYKKLIKEREKVEKTIKKYQDLNAEQNHGEIFINKNYTKYFLLIVIIFILVFVFIKFLPNSSTIQEGGNLNNNTYLYIFVIIGIICVISYKNN